MPIINRIADFHPEMTQWRHQIHAHPETAFEEHKTAAFVAEHLESFGITVERGIAGTGVIGTLRGSAAGRRESAIPPLRPTTAGRSRDGARLEG